ncbi:MAG: PQQ-dependent catabolism-associated CXXCW motif protein [Acetobacteraceae bacterium]|nr:PQQ-dependent catabolism-associated CXXCW motif protein [Acetobacteraceae bacterium]
MLVLAIPLAPAGADPGVPVPDGYRMEPYRGPTPDAVPSGHVVHTAELKAMLDAGHVALIDVMTAPRRPEGMRPDAPWMPLPRRDLPGSIWLPDVGRGAINPALEAHFRAVLERATDGSRDAPVVFYCLAQCWMSWNAAKRAASFGWRNVYWYPDGTDGWEEAGLPLTEAQPEPFE